MSESRAAELLLPDVLAARVASSKKVWTLSIDGATASGKTVCANALAELLRAHDLTVVIFQMDWTLTDRSLRQDELERFREHENMHFELEPELHMRLDLLSGFLFEVNEFNGNDSSSRELSLTGLYNRESGGRCDGSATMHLDHNTVLIIEGHYGLRPEFNRSVDFHCVLVAEPDNLRKRKIDRVKGYRNSKDASDYFDLVDLPSFAKHLSNFWHSVDVAIDNGDFGSPRKISALSLADYYPRGNRSGDGIVSKQLASFEEMSMGVLSPSSLVPKEHSVDFVAILTLLRDVDCEVRRRLTITATSNIVSLRDWIAEELKRPSRGIPKKCEVLDLSNVKNVYSRSLPMTMLVEFQLGDLESKGLIQFTVGPNKTHINIFFQGSISKVRWDRDREYTTYADDEMSHLAFRNEVGSSTALTIVKPTHFIEIPLGESEQSRIDVSLTGKEDLIFDLGSLIEGLVDTPNCLWVHRFPLHRTSRALAEALASCGFIATKLGNYLTAAHVGGLLSRGMLHHFFEKTSVSVWEDRLSQEDELAADSLTLQERSDGTRELAKIQSSLIKAIDGELFSEINIFDSRFPSLVDDLVHLLGAQNRSVRKMAAEYVLANFPRLTLSSSRMWSLLDPKVPEKSVLFSELIRLSPTILAELFLWLGVREEPSAVLATNIYDIRPAGSVDGQAYLDASASKGQPIIIQTSFNAIGHSTGEAEGYLRLKNTPGDYIDSVLNSARRVFLETGNFPLFGLGIDHLNSANDQPPGRTKEFSKRLFASGRLTYFVLDAESLFEAQNQDPPTLVAAYSKMLAFMRDLLENNEKDYLVDKEICVSELNYVGNNAWVPTPEHIELFVDLYRQSNRVQGMAYVNTRPHLFIGNVGTTHHSEDIDSGVDTTVARSWIDAVFARNFVSAVLHGTTSTARSHLVAATDGCYKINIAGEFLKELISVAPQSTNLEIGGFSADTKLAMPRLSEAFATEAGKLELDRAHNHMRKVALELMADIQSPILTDADFDFFQHKQFVFESGELEEIRRALLELGSSSPTATIAEPSQPVFAPSLIEVPFGAKYKRFVNSLSYSGANYFHVDVCDGHLVPRVIDARDKVEFLNSLTADTVVGVHLMVRDPHQREVVSGLSFIESYARVGADYIGFHLRALSDSYPQEVCNAIKNSGSQAGIFLEVDEPFGEVHKTLIFENNIEWVACMAVPIGYGGQKFDLSVLEKVAEIREFAEIEGLSLRLEVDGGLTRQNIVLGRKAGADTFAGWSIIEGSSDDQTLANYSELTQWIQAID